MPVRLLCYTLLMLAACQARADEEDPIAASQRSDDCGAMCLFIALRSLDVEVADVQAIFDRMGKPPEGGYSLSQLSDVALSFGVQTRGVETSTDNLSRRPGRFACIAHYNEGHFVNLINVEKGHVHLIDAPRSAQVPIETFDSVWSRKALLISHDPILAEADLPTEWNWGRIAIIAVIVLLSIGAVWLVPQLRRRRTALP